MTTPFGTEVLILIPTKYLKGKWSTYTDEEVDCYMGSVSFLKLNYSALKGVIATNPKIDEVKSGLCPLDLSHGFGNGNFGCTVSLAMSDSKSKA